MSKKTLNSLAKTLFWVALGLVVVIILILGIHRVIETKAEPEVEYWEEYTVKYGDTLWTIVPQNNNYDVRVIINMVKEHNNIGSDIIVGQIIELPVLK